MTDGYVCANCNVGFPTRKERTKHMVEVHDSPFVEGEERDIQDSIVFAKAQEQKGNNKSITRLKDAGREVA